MDQFRCWIGTALLTLLLAAAVRCQDLPNQTQIHLDVLVAELQLDAQQRKVKLHQRLFQDAKNISRYATSNESVSWFTCEPQSTMQTLALLRELRVIDVISRPQCVTTAGRTAKLTVGQDVCVAGKNQTVGLQLEMTPSLAGFKRIRLQFDATYSYWVKNAKRKIAKGGTARIAARQLNTTTEIPEGQALVIVIGRGNQPKNAEQDKQKNLIYVVRPRRVDAAALNQWTRQRSSRVLPAEFVKPVVKDLRGRLTPVILPKVAKFAPADLHIVPNPKKAILRLIKGGVSFECKEITLTGVKGRRIQVASMGRGVPMRIVGSIWQAQAEKLIHSPSAKQLILEGDVNLSYSQLGSSVSVEVERVVIDLQTGQMNYSATVDLTEDPNSQQYAPTVLPSPYSRAPYSPVTSN